MTTIRIVLLLSDAVLSSLHQNGQIKGLNDFDYLQITKDFCIVWETKTLADIFLFLALDEMETITSNNRQFERIK